MEQKDNNGALFKNDEKKTDKHPDYSGQALINGVEMWVSGWIKESKKGTKFMSLAFNRKDKKAEKPAALQSNDDDCPF